MLEKKFPKLVGSQFIHTVRWLGIVVDSIEGLPDTVPLWSFPSSAVTYELLQRLDHNGLIGLARYS